MIPMVTSRHRAVHEFNKLGERPGFVPVRTSLGKPKFIPDAAAWPYVGELAPAGMFHLDGDEFETRYRLRLDRFGVDLIADRLLAIAEDYPGQSLALLCFEDVTEKPCHRSIFGRWWFEQTGQTIRECNAASDLPVSAWEWTGATWRQTVPTLAQPGQLELTGGTER
jgi:hypothetical protein